MGIPLDVAKTLFSRVEMLEKGDLASLPLFVLKDFFSGINEKADATDVFNFLYQLDIRGSHPDAFMAEALKELPIFSPFKLTQQYHYILLKPEAFLELPENRGKYGGMDIIRINYFDHTYSIRIDDKLKEVETLLECKTLDSMGLTPKQVEICECAQDLLAGSTVKKRIRMVRCFRQGSENDPWLAKSVFAPVRIMRLMRYNKTCAKIFFAKKKHLMHAAKKLSDAKVALHQANMKCQETNAAIKAWVDRYHDKVVSEVQAVISFLNELGYVQKDEQWWY